jgi:ABC-type lipoprotein release transport system permease subunit
MMVIGYTLMSFSIGLTEGGYGTVISTFTNAKTGHIQLYKENFIDVPNLYKSLKGIDEKIQKYKAMPDIVAVAPRIQTGGLLLLDETTMGTAITAVDYQLEKEVSTLEKRIERGRWFSGVKAYELLLGKNIARILEAEVGSKVAVITQGADGSISNDYFVVAGILKAGPFDNFNAYMEFKAAQEFLVMKGRAHKLIVKLDSYKKSQEIAEILKKQVPKHLTVSPWFEVEKDFYKGMQADKKGNSIFYFILGIVVAIGVLNTILMSFLERKREFGVLKAIGTSPSFIFLQIMVEALLLSLMGISIGLVLSYLLNWYFSFNGINLGTSMEFGGIVWEQMFSSLDPQAFIIPTAIILLSTIFVGLYPAIMAAKVAPTDAMRAN